MLEKLKQKLAERFPRLATSLLMNLDPHLRRQTGRRSHNASRFHRSTKCTAQQQFRLPLLQSHRQPPGLLATQLGQSRVSRPLLLG